MVRNIQRLSADRVWQAIEASQPEALRRPEGWDALVAYHNIRQPLVRRSAGEHPGCRARFGSLIDPLLREHVLAIFAEHFASMPEAEYADRITQHERLLRWLVEPLG